MSNRGREQRTERMYKRRAHGLEQCNNFVVGGEVLHMSNPGDYPLREDDNDVDFDVVEVDAN